MSTRRLRRLSLVALAGLLAACVPVTVNINFPQEKLEGAAGRIEDMVRSPENPPPAPPKKSPQGRLRDRLLAALAPREAAAQGRTIEVAQEPRVDNPDIQRAVNSRNARLGELDQWKARGCIGENNRGLVEPRPGQGCSGDVGRLVGAENADRQVIMGAFMRQNNIPGGDAPRVQAAFAKAARDRARPGEWVQLESGQWVRK